MNRIYRTFALIALAACLFAPANAQDISNPIVNLTGTWTPTDQSGAALTFTSVNCRYERIGNTIRAYGTFTYPVTASGANTLIGGLPFTVPNAAYAQAPGSVGDTAGSLPGVITRTVVNSTTFQFYNNAAGSPVTNVLVSTATVIVNVIYPAQ